MKKHTNSFVFKSIIVVGFRLLLAVMLVVVISYLFYLAGEPQAVWLWRDVLGM